MLYWGTAVLTNVTFADNAALGTAGAARRARRWLAILRQECPLVPKDFCFSARQAQPVNCQVVRKVELLRSSAELLLHSTLVSLPATKLPPMADPYTPLGAH